MHRKRLGSLWKRASRQRSRSFFPSNNHSRLGSDCIHRTVSESGKRNRCIGWEGFSGMPRAASRGGACATLTRANAVEKCHSLGGVDAVRHETC